MDTTDDARTRWEESGAMNLCGRPDSAPLHPPSALLPRLDDVGSGLRRHARGGIPLLDNMLGRLTDRAASYGYQRRGTTSCNGASRLLRTDDRWIAVTLAREDDVDLVPAWLGVEPGNDIWATVDDAVTRRNADDVVAAGRLVGLPVAVLGETRSRPRAGVLRTAVTRRPTNRPARPLVVDLSGLWAGPLCSQILRQVGARVVKVESTQRPDGARRGRPDFFEFLNGGKKQVAFDFTSPSEVDELRHLISRADIVIEGSRPRALEQVGIVATDFLESGPRVWISITGHGRDGEPRNWTAFGDDAAVAGGLVVHDDEGPCFCADAIADPLTGLTAALAGLEAMADDDAVLLDVAMAHVAAEFADPTPGADVERARIEVATPVAIAPSP